jgi:hypothetical protein
MVMAISFPFLSVRQVREVFDNADHRCPGKESAWSARLRLSCGGYGGVVPPGVGLLGHDSCGGNGAVCALPLGPGGEAVNGTAPGTAWLLLRLRDV